MEMLDPLSGTGTGLKFPSSPGEFKMYDTSILDQESQWSVHNAHDPGIIKTGEGYYVFSTDVRVGGELVPGVMVRKSEDLIHWQWVQYALPGIPQVALDWANSVNLWAPDVVKVNGRYRMYYSASSFGSRQSLIGLQTAAHIEGPWEDEGVVIKTRGEDPVNAIDANVLECADGRMWMVYGSFFGGIHITELDPDSGKPLEDGFGKLLAVRDKATEDGAVEGPYIIYNDQFKQYYLFLSYDSLFEDYNVRVARSNSITGPYLDAHGCDVADITHMPQHEVGVKVMGGYRFGEDPGWIAPGHNSVLNDNGSYYMVHHARGGSDKLWPYLHIRRILWTAEGWPVVSPERYAGETQQNIPAALIPGEWERIVHDPGVDGQVQSVPLKLFWSGELSGEHGQGHWTHDGEQTLTLVWSRLAEGEGHVEKVQLLPAWDWEQQKPALVFTGMNDNGICSWGKQSS